MADPARVTIAITTKDRCDDLRGALVSALAQEAPGVELLVIDDGSSDGTAEMVRREFPAARVERSDRSLGLIGQRNRAARLARAPILISIDDDARFTSPQTVEQTLRDFDDPRIAAVAIPFVDVRRSDAVQQAPPERSGRWVTAAYRGTAHALRRDVFLGVGGYRPSYEQQNEEHDYCLRMLDAGYVTRLGRATPIDHLESPSRDPARLIALGRRNDLLHGWHNVPLPYLPVRLAKASLYGLAFGMRQHALRAVVHGLAAGWSAGLRGRVSREPVARSTYRVDHLLRTRGPLPLDEIEPLLPEIGHDRRNIIARPARSR